MPSRSILPLVCSGRGIAAPVWVHQCASVPLCEPCRERADRRWPKARWVLRHSGQMSSSMWKVIRHDLREVQVDGVRCLDNPSVVLPLLLWWAALDGDSRVLWLWHHGGGLATQWRMAGRMYGAVWPGVQLRCTLGTVPGVVGACAKEMVQWTWPRPSWCLQQRREQYDGHRDVAGPAGLIVRIAAPACTAGTKYS